MRDPRDIRHGDTWEIRDGLATVVASNDWPPPPTPPRLGHAPGCMCTAHIDQMLSIAAKAWSRANQETA